jgi:hypothetical protein
VGPEQAAIEVVGRLLAYLAKRDSAPTSVVVALQEVVGVSADVQRSANELEKSRFIQGLRCRSRPSYRERKAVLDRKA